MPYFGSGGMSILRRLFAPRPVPNPGRELAMIPVKRHRDAVREKARAMRQAFGLPIAAAFEVKGIVR